MNDLRIVTVASLLIIFTCVFFIHFAFENFITISEYCAMKGGEMCQQGNMSLMFSYSLACVIAFIVVIETTIFFMFKSLEIYAQLARKRGDGAR